MRLPRDSSGSVVAEASITSFTTATSSSTAIGSNSNNIIALQNNNLATSSSSSSNCKLVGNKENVQPEGGGAPAAESSAAANLLWLLDFRLDNLLPNDGNSADKMASTTNTLPINKETNEPSSSTNSGHSNHNHHGGSGSSPAGSSAAHNPTPAVKPPYTYTELIEQALSEKGPLTVAEIYRWISERFPYFKANDDRWKNSVRHNLSISPHFRKSVKARTGTGHLWTLALPPSARTIAANLAQKAKENNSNGSNTQQEEVQDEVARACMELLRAEGSPPVGQSTEYEPSNQNGRQSPLTFEKAAELMLAESSGANNCEGGRVQVEFLARPLQILAHMEQNGSCSPEFLNPIPRDELMEESGLFSMQDPFPHQIQHHHNHHHHQQRHHQTTQQCHPIQFVTQVTEENQMQTEEVNFDPFPHAVNDATSMLFGDDYPLSYSYEIL